jgi:hypothetical protein
MSQSEHDRTIGNFVHGKADAASNLMSLTIHGSRTLLVGYGWAVYAIKDSDGDVIRYNGWKGYSNTTSRHLNLLDGFVDFESDKKPQVDEILGLVDGEPPA